MASIYSFARKLRRTGCAEDGAGVRYRLTLGCAGDRWVVQIHTPDGRRGYIGHMAGAWDECALPSADKSFLKTALPAVLVSLPQARRAVLLLAARRPDLPARVAAKLEIL